MDKISSSILHMNRWSFVAVGTWSGQKWTSSMF